LYSLGSISLEVLDNEELLLFLNDFYKLFSGGG
jgi:hypothetical protein